MGHFEAITAKHIFECVRGFVKMKQFIKMGYLITLFNTIRFIYAANEIVKCNKSNFINISP